MGGAGGAKDLPLALRHLRRETDDEPFHHAAVWVCAKRPVDPCRQDRPQAGQERAPCRAQPLVPGPGTHVARRPHPTQQQPGLVVEAHGIGEPLGTPQAGRQAPALARHQRRRRVVPVEPYARGKPPTAAVPGGFVHAELEALGAVLAFGNADHGAHEGEVSPLELGGQCPGQGEGGPQDGPQETGHQEGRQAPDSARRSKPEGDRQQPAQPQVRQLGELQGRQHPGKKGENPCAHASLRPV